MITNYTIGKTPVAITTAGQSGTCWISEDYGYSNNDDIRIMHAGSTDYKLGKKIFVPKSNNDVMVISADSETDVYYAVSVSSNPVIIVVDVK